MSQTIQKPEANPIVSALLTAFVLNLGHLIINGQQRKWIMTLLGTFIGMFLCCVPGIVVSIFSIVESYQTAERLQKGEAIGENEYTNPTLFKMIKIIDKTATCNRA